MKRTIHTAAAAVVPAVVALAVALVPSSPARACGGIVSEQGAVSQDGQFSLLVVGDDQTDVFLSLTLPDASQPFGVLIPVPSEPTIDANAVDGASLDALDQGTRPTLVLPSSDEGDGGFFACGAPALAGRAGDKGAIAEPSVDIGPVTATWLSGADGQTAGDWLSQRGFTLPDGGQAILDGYVNTQGMSFLAIERNDDAAEAGAAARVGVHFTLAGVHPAYALQMLKLGGTDPISVTVLVAKKGGGVGPDTPYKAIAMAELDPTVIEDESYASAVQKGVAAVGGKAFVVETVSNIDDIVPGNALIPSGFIVTRLSTVLAKKDLDADVSFTTPAAGATAAGVGAAGLAMPSGPTRPTSRGFGDAAMLLAFASLLVVLTKQKPRASSALARAFAS